MAYENSYYDPTVNSLTETDIAILMGFLGFYLIFVGIIVAFNIVINWKLFKKSGRPGWYAFIPIYDQLQLFKMTWGSWVPYVLLLFVPIVNIVIACIHPFKIAKAFGESTLFGVLILLVPFIGLPILAFGSAKYIGPNGEPEYFNYNKNYEQEPKYQNENNQNEYY